MFGLGAYRRWLRSDRVRLGRWGERRARAFLRRRGYRIIARNWRCPAGEVDLVAADPSGPIAFVEVKTRRDEHWAPGQQAVHERKQQHLARVAQWFARRYGLKDRSLRFDVIVVVVPETGRVEVRHYPSAFRPPC
ncbi:MAG TPA: YraN family protein [Phycisphaerales bacterium]|nr:YraN family protein [Phycisphaerales bacterium]